MLNRFNHLKLAFKHQSKKAFLLNLNQASVYLSSIKTKATASNGPSIPVNNDVILPKSVKVVICGGGLIGTSIAYHLAQLGYKDIILVTRNK